MAGVLIKTKDNKVVGVLKSGILYKNVKKSKHLFRKIGDRGSWGIDSDVLFTRLPERSSIEIFDADDATTYTSTVGNWKEYGEILHFKTKQEDYGVQVFLPIEYFTKKAA